MELDFRKKKEEVMKAEDHRRKAEDRENQQMYGQTLHFQSDISAKMRKNYGSMTEQEKKMNKQDLRSYKDGES